MSVALPSPTPNMTSISDQQQPTQNAPWAMPISSGFAPLGDAAPAIDDEAQRAPALVEAAVAERAELPQPGDEQGRGQDQLRVRRQHRDRLDAGVDAAIQQPGAQAEGRPHDEIADEQEQADEPAGSPAPADERPEGHDQRDARRQHHRHDHQDPAEAEQRRLEGQGPGAAVVPEERAVRRPPPTATAMIQATRRARPSDPTRIARSRRGWRR